MATNPPLFRADARHGDGDRRAGAAIDAVAPRGEEQAAVGAPIATDAPRATDVRVRLRRWMAEDVTFVAVATAAIAGTLLGLAALAVASRPDAAPPEPDVVPAVEVAPEREPEPVIEPPEPEPVPPPVPLTLRVGTIGVDAPLVSVGLEPDGAMEIPDDVREVGWYDPDDLGVRPGTTGTAVFASHVDSRSQGRGVLFELRQTRAGDTIEIDLEDGSTQTWVVTEVAQIPKVSMPLGEIFTWSGPPRVVIITCGGEFDRSARSYVDNIVVYAELAAAHAAGPPPA